MSGTDSVFLALMASLAVMSLATWIRIQWFD